MQELKSKETRQMMDCYTFLTNLFNYPIGEETIRAMCYVRGVSPSDFYDPNVRVMQLLRADLYSFMAQAPDISENGVAFSHSKEDKEQFQATANRIYRCLGEETAGGAGSKVYGYKGSSL